MSGVGELDEVKTQVSTAIVAVVRSAIATTSEDPSAGSPPALLFSLEAVVAKVVGASRARAAMTRLLRECTATSDKVWVALSNLCGFITIKRELVDGEIIMGQGVDHPVTGIY